MQTRLERQAAVSAGARQRLGRGQVVAPGEPQGLVVQGAPAEAFAQRRSEDGQRPRQYPVASRPPALGGTQPVQQLALGHGFGTDQRHAARLLRPTLQQGQHRGTEILDMQRLQTGTVVQQRDQRPGRQALQPPAAGGTGTEGQGRTQHHGGNAEPEQVAIGCGLAGEKIGIRVLFRTQGGDLQHPSAMGRRQVEQCAGAAMLNLLQLDAIRRQQSCRIDHQLDSLGPDEGLWVAG